nr:choline kinase [Quercus suber]
MSAAIDYSASHSPTIAHGADGPTSRGHDDTIVMTHLPTASGRQTWMVLQPSCSKAHDHSAVHARPRIFPSVSPWVAGEVCWPLSIFAAFEHVHAWAGSHQLIIGRGCARLCARASLVDRPDFAQRWSTVSDIQCEILLKSRTERSLTFPVSTINQPSSHNIGIARHPRAPSHGNMPHVESKSPRPAGILKRDSSYGLPEGASPSSYLGLSQYSISPRDTPKSVSISAQAEVISPLMLGNQKNVEDFDLENCRTSRKQLVKSYSDRRMSGRPPVNLSPALKPSMQANESHPRLESSAASYVDDKSDQFDSLVDQVSSWLKLEKEKKAARKAKTAARKARLQDGAKDGPAEEDDGEVSDGGLDLENLENILKQNLHLDRRPSRKSSVASLRNKLSTKRLQRKPSAVSSDTEFFDNEVLVPSSDVLLDNSNTLAYTGGHSESEESETDDPKKNESRRDLDAWAKLKFETLRLIHTLRLKGWRKVPLELSGACTIQRLSGALTNAVYVVSPPENIPTRKDKSDAPTPLAPRKPPPKLLLRIYGPQVEHLIDRESELAILRRLAKKRIGPRMLGTFANGRFEEFFHAQTLTPEDLRCPDTSRQIAKRMRELHDGIELLEKERDDGAFVWRNWDKWVQRVEQVVSWLDEQVTNLPEGFKPVGPDGWKRRGLICGVPWKVFRDVVEKYRAWLDEQYGGSRKIREQLVFAHNDAQYGNLLRLMPTGESPLLLPANTHKQLVVIDFEYSNANLPGQEFANHFTEWCYNYHDERKPYACNTQLYPTLEEQERFIRAYVRHRPQFNVSTPKLAPQPSPSLGETGSTSIPAAPPLKRNTTSITNFMLDARVPNGLHASQPSWSDEDAAQKAFEDGEVARLMHETRLWRVANSAQWVAWGIVQAKVPGMPDFGSAANKDGIGTDAEELTREELAERAEEYRDLASEPEQEQSEEAEQEEFDYLGYAQHRAMFFWGDVLQLGLVTMEELPEDVRPKIKTVLY